MIDLEKNQAKIYKRTDIDGEHYFVAIPDQHWTRGMDRMQRETVASKYVPTHTRFTKLPHWNSLTSKEELIEGLREQLEYWELQMAGKEADEINAMTGMGDEDFDYGKNKESYYRYKKRAEACCYFLDVLQENPGTEDVKIYHTHYTDVEYPK